VKPERYRKTTTEYKGWQMAAYCHVTQRLPMLGESPSPQQGESSGCGIYWISSQGQTTRGGSSAWGLNVGLTTLPERHRHISLITLYVNSIAQRGMRKREKEKEKTRWRIMRKGRRRKCNSPPQSWQEICAHDVTV
jgi:hypothetical protein